MNRNTLDEPYKETIMRDLKKIKDKLVHVMIPRLTPDKSQQLKNCIINL